MDARHHWGRTDIQIAFTIFVATETWLVPVEGWFVDRFGPRHRGHVRRHRGGHRLVAQLDRQHAADAVHSAAALSGVGAGAVYGTCVGNALKWFADRRGLAAGLTAAGFGAGAAATVVPIITVIRTYGYETRFPLVRNRPGAVILALSQFLKAPAPGEAPKAAPQAQPELARLHADGDARDADLLDPLRHVRAGRGERPRRDRAGGADRQGLQASAGCR